MKLFAWALRLVVTFTVLTAFAHGDATPRTHALRLQIESCELRSLFMVGGELNNIYQSLTSSKPSGEASGPDTKILSTAELNLFEASLHPEHSQFFDNPPGDPAATAQQFIERNALFLRHLSFADKFKDNSERVKVAMLDFFFASWDKDRKKFNAALPVFDEKTFDLPFEVQEELKYKGSTDFAGKEAGEGELPTPEQHRKPVDSKKLLKEYRAPLGIDQYKRSGILAGTAKAKYFNALEEGLDQLDAIAKEIFERMAFVGSELQLLTEEQINDYFAHLHAGYFEDHPEDVPFIIDRWTAVVSESHLFVALLGTYSNALDEGRTIIDNSIVQRYETLLRNILESGYGKDEQLNGDYLTFAAAMELGAVLDQSSIGSIPYRKGLSTLYRTK